jgi:hypothetical protein
MHGAIPPLPHKSSWLGAQLKKAQDSFTFTLVEGKKWSLLTRGNTGFYNSQNIGHYHKSHVFFVGNMVDWIVGKRKTF